MTYYAVLVGGSNGDGAWRGLVTIVELIDPRSYIFQSAEYGRLIYAVIYMSDRLLTQENPNPRLPPPPGLRSKYVFPAATRVYSRYSAGHLMWFQRRGAALPQLSGYLSWYSSIFQLLSGKTQVDPV